jgi:hypothetical protein
MDAPAHTLSPALEDAHHALQVRQFRLALLWPLRLMPSAGGDAVQRRAWQELHALGDASAWREVVDEYTGDREGFHERHYNEFVTFLPQVQHFLYGEGRARRGAGDRGAESPMRVFRRHDVAAVRVVPREGDAPLTLQVVHVDLYFFYDVDVVLFNLELRADELVLAHAQEVMYRLGRGYPAAWDAQGRALNCMAETQWLDAGGRVLAGADMHERDAFLADVCEHRAPRIASHWAFLLAPLVPDHTPGAGALRFRQLEYYRMPLMAWLALDDPCALSRSDFIRLGLVVDAAGGGAPPFAEQHLADFESRHCFDRFWADAGPAPRTRYLCSGHALVVVGSARSTFYCCPDRGVLAQFRHQHFLLFLIAHFQKAALLMFSDRMVEALKRLDVTDATSIKHFKREIRSAFEGFLRFTHRYWFHEISDQAQARALFRLTTGHLGIDPLYTEVKERIGGMSDYLEADSLRRQANMIVRLTVVTILALIGALTTGFLGMNLLDEGNAPIARRIALFALVATGTVVLTFYTVAKSKRLADFLDAVSDERLSAWAKVKALAAVWRRGE